MLTDTWLRKNQGRITDKEEIKTDRDGLAARLRNGRISWIFRATLKTGERIKLTFGFYPGINLSDAREKAIEYKAQIAEGEDPRKLRAAKIQKAANELTVDQLYDYWFDNYCAKKKKGADQHKRTYEIHIQPKFGGILYRDLQRRALVRHLIELTGSYTAIVERALIDLKQVFTYGLDHALTDRPNVLEGVGAATIGLSKRQETRILSEEEIRLFFHSLDKSDMAEKNKIFMKLLIFYGCRSAELRQTERGWLDFEKSVWSVPAEYHKTGHKTKRALARPIIPEIEQLWRRAIEISGSGLYVFTSLRNRKDSTSSVMSKGSAEFLPASLLRWALLNLRDEEGRPVVWDHWSNHDLRRTARTAWSQWGEWSTCEKMLGHRLPGESDVYDRFDYIPQMVPIYKQWWAYLQATAYGEGKVVAFRKSCKVG